MEASDWLVLGVALALPLMWLGSLADAALRPGPQWAAAGVSKATWVVRLLVVGWVAGFVYLVHVRPRLLAVRPVPRESRERERVPWRRSQWGDPWSD